MMRRAPKNVPSLKRHESNTGLQLNATLRKEVTVIESAPAATARKIERTADAHASPQSRFGRELCIAFVFVALTLLMTYPWALSLRDAASDAGDPYINSWILWWDYHQTFRDPLHLFHANIFYPLRYTLAFSEHDYGIAVVFFPLFALGLQPLTVHGAALLTGYAFSGYGAFRLVRTLTNSTGAGWTAGVAFAFAPYHFHQLPHLTYSFAGWMPLVLEALVLFAREPTRKRAAWLGVAFFMNGLTCIHWLVLTAIPLLVSTLFLAGRRRRWLGFAFWLRAFVAVGAGGLLLLPFMIPYLRVSKLYNFVRPPEETLRFSATIESWLTIDERNKLWTGLGKSLAPYKTELALFPGALPLLCLALVIAFVAWRFIASRRVSRTEKLTPSLDFHENTTDAISLGMIWIALGFAGSFGLNFAFHKFLFEHVQLFQSIRVPARWAMICVLGLAIISGVAARLLIQSAVAFIERKRNRSSFSLNGTFPLNGKGRRVAVALYLLFVAAFLFEERVAPLDLIRGEVDPDALTLQLKRTPMRGGIVELPVAENNANYRYTLRAADHARPLITAVSGFTSPQEHEIETLTHEAHVPDRFLDLLEEIPASYLVIHNYEMKSDERGAIENFLARGVASGRLRFIRRFNVGDDLYAVTKTEPNATSDQSAPELRASWSALLSEETPTILLDKPEWGATVCRFYIASFGRLPRFAEFLPDAVALGSDMSADEITDAPSAARVAAFADSWTERTAFKDAFGALTEEEFVDKLLAQSGAGGEDRARLVADLKDKRATRADLLSRIVQNRNFARKEYQRAFVLMNYFVYLRRDPDAPPDADLSGFNFWLEKLKRTNDYDAIAKAFRESDERRARIR